MGLSLIMTLQPASPFQPDKTALDTLKRFDDVDGTAPFEFFRLKAQNMGSALQLLAANQEATTSPGELAENLRAVASELERSARLLSGQDSDAVGFMGPGGKHMY